MENVPACWCERIALGLISAAVSRDRIVADKAEIAAAAKDLGYALYPDILVIEPGITPWPLPKIKAAIRGATAAAVFVPEMTHWDGLGGSVDILAAVSALLPVFAARGQQPEPYRGPECTRLGVPGGNERS